MTARVRWLARQSHVNERNPVSVLVFPFLNGIRLKSQFGVEQQARKVLMETGYPDLGGLMFYESQVNHPFDEIRPHAPSTGCRGDDEIADRTTAAGFLAVKIGKSHNRAIEFNHRRV